MGTKNLREKGSIDFINVSNFNEYAPKIVIRHSWKESLLAPNRFISISICAGVPVCSSWDYVLWNNYCIWINTKLGGIFRRIISLWSEYEWLSTLISAMVVNSIVILCQSFSPPTPIPQQIPVGWVPSTCEKSLGFPGGNSPQNAAHLDRAQNVEKGTSVETITEGNVGSHWKDEAGSCEKVRSGALEAVSYSWGRQHLSRGVKGWWSRPRPAEAKVHLAKKTGTRDDHWVLQCFKHLWSLG